MNRFNKILYLLDDNINELSPSLLRAVALAKNNQAELTLLYVRQKLTLPVYSRDAGIDGEKLEKNILAHEQTKIEQLIKSLDKNVNAKAELRVGKKYVESIRAVLADNFDLVIKKADSISWLDRFIGSDDMHLLRKCPCPVWLMKKDEKPDYDSIMAAVDFDTDGNDSVNDELSETIMNLASSVALLYSASLHVVNAYDVPDAGFISLWVDDPEKVERELFASEHSLRQHKMDMLFSRLQHRLDEKSYKYLSPSCLLVKGIPGQEIPKVANRINADLVVMGTVARTGIAGVVIGNTAENVLSQLNCSVLAIKPKGFISPVV